MHHSGWKRGMWSIIFLVTFMFWNIGEKHDFLLSQVDKKNQTCKVCTRLRKFAISKSKKKVASLDGKVMSRKSPLFSVLQRLSNMRRREDFRQRISNPVLYPLSYHPTTRLFLTRICCQKAKVSLRWAATNRLCWKFLPCGMTACGCSCKAGGHSRPLETELEAAEITAEFWDDPPVRTGWWDDWVPGNLTARKE